VLIDRSVEDPADEAARKDAWDAALHGLTERQRVTVTLRCHHSMTFEEIGRVLGLSGWSIKQTFDAAVALVKASGRYQALCPN
jgi:DNA-directed RNA polymerase specialized sigma24 family protein